VGPAGSRIRRLLRKLAIAVLAASCTGAVAPGADGAAPSSDLELAGRCVAIESAARDRFVAVADADSYRAGRAGKAGATAFLLKPTGLGTYLLHDPDGRLLSATRAGDVERAAVPGRLGEWAPRRVPGAAVAIRSTAGPRELAVSAGGGTLIAARPASAGSRRLFRLVPKRGCRRFPEAQVGAVRTSSPRTGRAEGRRGFADLHLHITADLRAGGRIISGRAFHRFGIPRALGGDASIHGADGSLDVTGNLLRTGLPFGTHDTEGWPSFRGWPVHDTNTHQQVYYVWLKRVWRAGLRLAVAQAVEDEPICRIVPRRSYSCDETRAIARQIRRLRALQDYVDAQSDGRGRGWFRLVYGPRQARRVIDRGKLAVVIGVESSNPFGCSMRLGTPRCTRADVDRGIDRLHRLGVRSMFVAHWVDNALAGAALEGGVRGVFINIFNRFQTGRYFETARCPEPGQGEEVRTLSPVEMQVLAGFYPAAAPLLDEAMPTYPTGRRCNTRGLTGLGRYALRRLMAKHMLIEADHLSERARESVLALAERRGYPLVSSHTGTGGSWTPAELRRLHALGGIAAARLETARSLARGIRRLERHRPAGDRLGVALGTDVGGFSSLPGPRSDAGRDPLRYPFTSAGFRFVRQRTGGRVFDLNTDGVAHYGLLADLLADMHGQGGSRALRSLFRSADAYVQTWRRAAP
jgi:microsomal dipeptidase-like Zn-dependent dipeptidase